MGKKRHEIRESSKVKAIFIFLVFELIFSMVSAPLIIFYGPFETLKKTVVGAAMSSFSHQYIAKLFLTSSQISAILNNGGVNGPPGSQNVKQNLNLVNTNSSDTGIEFHKITGRKFDGYVLVIHDPKRVKVGYTQKLGVQGEKTSQIAMEYNAVAAINGGGFTDKAANSTAIWTGTGAFPEGIVIADGKVIYPKSGLNPNKLINGCIVGLATEGLLVTGNYSLDELKNMNIRDAIAFGPPLIINGIPQSKDSNGVNINNQGTAPRTAIGQRRDGSILFLVADGRQGLMAGATIKDIQTVMLQENAYTAVNLDGGASATMYYNGRVINSPSDKFGERPIPTIFYVK